MAWSILRPQRFIIPCWAKQTRISVTVKPIPDGPLMVTGDSIEVQDAQGNPVAVKVDAAYLSRRPPCHVFRTGGRAGWRACDALSNVGRVENGSISEIPDKDIENMLAPGRDRCARVWRTSKPCEEVRR
jgi:hypothetical protein